MSKEIIIIDNVKFRRRSIFDLLRLYRMVWYWLEFNNFKAKEDKYIDRTVPGFGKIVEFHWSAKKDQSDYFRYVIKLSALITGLKPVEIEQKGKKIKLDNADIEFRMTAKLVLDPDDKFEKNIFTKMFKPFYEKVIVRKRTEEYKEDIYSKAYTLQEEVKNYLGMYSQ